MVYLCELKYEDTYAYIILDFLFFFPNNYFVSTSFIIKVTRKLEFMNISDWKGSFRLFIKINYIFCIVYYLRSILLNFEFNSDIVPFVLKNDSSNEYIDH